MRATRGSNNVEHTRTSSTFLSAASDVYKFLAVVNGGAIVALLSFMASDKATCTSQTVFLRSMILFIGGISFCGLSLLLAYAVEFHAHRTSTKEIIVVKFVQFIGVMIALVSLTCFSLGALKAVESFATGAYGTIIAAENDRQMQLAEGLEKKLSVVEKRLSAAEEKTKELKKKNGGRRD